MREDARAKAVRLAGSGRLNVTHVDEYMIEAGDSVGEYLVIWHRGA